MIKYWPMFEVGLMLALLSLVLWLLWRSARRNAGSTRPPLPATLAGRLRHAGLYILRLCAVGVGTFLLLALAIMIERNLYSVITETAPAPSEVDVPPGLGFDVEEVAFEGGDGLQMAGWFSPSRNGVTIIVLHGYGGNRSGMIWHARQLTAAGYGVLMYDERASGESEGTYRSYGWEDPRDVGGALAYLASRPEAGTGTGILGCSTGGQIALQGAAYHPQIGAVWADGPSTIRARDIAPAGNPVMGLLAAGNYMLDWMYEIKLGIDAPPAMIEIIGRIEPRPAMIVAGGTRHPLIGSEADLHAYYLEFAGEHTDMWVIPEATHCDGPARRPAEYAQRMTGFFDAAFGIERSEP